MNKGTHLKNYANYAPASGILASGSAGVCPAFSDWTPDGAQQFEKGEKSAEHLPANRILAACFVENFDHIAPFLERVSFKGDEFIHQPEELVRYVYFPESAVISELQILEDGRTVETAMIGSEGMTGLPALFNSQTMKNWTQVSLAGEALRIDLQVLKEEIEFGGALQTLLFDFTGSYLEQVSQRVVCNTHHPVENRLCTWLLMLADRCMSDEFSLTQEKIARFLGVHRPSVSNIAGSLREKNIIDYTRGKISILDRLALERTACPCYNLLREKVRTLTQ